MLKLYCTKCGSPTNYSLNKPKFCSACGKSFDEKASRNINNQQIKITKPTIDEIKNFDDEFDTESDSVDISKINLKNLNIEYIKDQSNKPKIKDLIGTSSGDNSLRKIKIKKQKINKKQFLEDFQKEAGTLRRKNV